MKRKLKNGLECSGLLAGLRTLSIFNRVQEIITSSSFQNFNFRVLRILFFEFGKNDRVQRVRVCSPGLYRSQWHKQINGMQLFFGKIITSIFTDCDFLNNKLLYFVVIFYFFSTIKIGYLTKNIFIGIHPASCITTS